jgi:hypothetical protein
MCTRASSKTREKIHIDRRANKTREEEEEEATTELTMTTDSFDNCTRQIEKKELFMDSCRKKSEKIILAFFIILLYKKNTYQKDISYQLKDMKRRGRCMMYNTIEKESFVCLIDNLTSHLICLFRTR